MELTTIKNRGIIELWVSYALEDRPADIPRQDSIQSQAQYWQYPATKTLKFIFEHLDQFLKANNTSIEEGKKKEGPLSTGQGGPHQLLHFKVYPLPASGFGLTTGGLLPFHSPVVIVSIRTLSIAPLRYTPRMDGNK